MEGPPTRRGSPADLIALCLLQLALTILFHCVFPTLTIGMGVVLVDLEGMVLRTREPIYETRRGLDQDLALSFAIEVATGITTELEFGTNRAASPLFVGDLSGQAAGADRPKSLATLFVLALDTRRRACV